MIEDLKKLLSGIDADYADIRYESRRDSTVIFDNRDLKQIGANTTDGYVVRVLKNGGFSSVAFTSRGDARKAIAAACENAVLLGGKAKKPARLAAAPAVKDSFKPALVEDPRDVTIDEKLELARAYNGIALAHPEIVSTNFRVFETIRDRHFASTEGAEVSEELVTCGCAAMITARSGTVLQNVRGSVGGSDGFQSVRGQEAFYEARTKIAIDLLSAEPVKGGNYDLVVNPGLAGVFTHEAFGHFSEADIIEDAPSIREKMRLGERLGAAGLTIVDDPTIQGALGFYRYDDEGVPAARVELMRDGVLTGRLHSRRTAAEFGEPINGHTVAEDYRFAPIIRMGTIFIQPGTEGFDSLIARLGDGLYLCDPKGGQTAGENFTFGAQYGYIVKGGKLDRMVRDINIAGNLYSTLKNVAAIGNDLELTKTGGCGKGQLNIRSCHGAPHVLIKNLVVGGA